MTMRLRPDGTYEFDTEDEGRIVRRLRWEELSSAEKMAHLRKGKPSPIECSDKIDAIGEAALRDKRQRS
jgi:benzoyl-CoA reductase/2-hydroxyglutaryl-CoA dehydratase subunit BcrC/BadD/HgdB